MKFGIQIWFLLSTLFFLTQCAQINPLQGGAKDRFAPRIDTAYSHPKNGTTNFNDDHIELRFSEYISLNKPSENIIITPQMSSRPEVEVKNKKLELTFQEPLQPNTTYTINFNRAVTDITEKNDSIFQVVFSTGDYIDSNFLQGKVILSETNRPAADYLVGLYPADAEVDFDSIPYKSRPYYIAQTNARGQFRMNYLKGGEYYIFAFDDQNSNLFRDQGESLAFKEGKVFVGSDSAQIKLRSYLPENNEIELRSTSFKYPGKITTVFSGTPTDFQLIIMENESEVSLRRDLASTPDSLMHWLTKNPTSGMQFIVSYNGQRDTIKPLYKGIPAPGEQVFLRKEDNLVQNKLLPYDTLKLTFSEPIQGWNKNGISFLDADSTALEKAEPFQIGLRTLAFPGLSKNIKHVKIDSATIQSFFNHTNQSDSWTSFEQLDTTFFGTLILNVDSVEATNVVVELLDKDNEVIAIQPLKDQLIFENLVPGDYQVRLIIDTNGDGEWTTGSLEERRQPENMIYNKELINIKSKWEKEVDWIIQKE